MRHEQEGSFDLVIGLLKIFHRDVYSLIDPGDTLSFVIPYVSMRFDVLPDALLYLF